MQLTAYVNGSMVPLQDACIHIEDRGFQFADGVYEVIACIGGTFLDLNMHLQRLRYSCEAIAINLPCSLHELAAKIEAIYQANPFDDAMIYVQITRGCAARSHFPVTTLTPSLIMTVRELPVPASDTLAQGAKAITLADIRWKRCDIKSVALLASVMGKQEAARKQADEAIWLDEQEHILEGCSTNVLAVIDGCLVTHPLGHRVLGGITRKIALHLAEQHGIRVIERPWRHSEPGLEECMLSSTTQGILPLCHIDGNVVGNGLPGPLTLRLREWLLQHFEMLKQGKSAT